jgi:hypothetical protein
MAMTKSQKTKEKVKERHEKVALTGDSCCDDSCCGDSGPSWSFGREPLLVLFTSQLETSRQLLLFNPFFCVL